MKIQLMSDLHMEFRAISLYPNKNSYKLIEKLDSSGVDVLVLAGDIATKLFLPGVLKAFADKFPEVIFVPGNHEYYGTIASRYDEKLDKICSKISNIHLLNSDKVVLNGQAFLGGTLWFKSIGKSPKKFSMGDFGFIRKFEPWVYNKNKEMVNFLTDNVDANSIIISHHLPSGKSMPNRFKSAPVVPFFICDMEELIKERQPKLWMHGHTHDQVDYSIEKTRVIANPLGYPGEKLFSKFNQKFIIEV